LGEGKFGFTAKTNDFLAALAKTRPGIPHFRKKAAVSGE